MELIERYLYAVGKKLPLQQKSDILEELRSIIMDNLDDATGGAQPTEEDVTKVLLEMGEPSEVAKRYRTGPSWLIGPDYYDLFLLITKIVLAVIVGASLLSLIVSLFTQSGGFGERLWYLLKQFVAIIPEMLTVIGSMTVIFAVIERTAKKPIYVDLGEGMKWNPSKLEAVPAKKDAVKPVESILGLVFSVLVLLALNFFSDKIGIYYISSPGEGWTMVQAFNQKALEVFIPLWSISLALNIGLHGWLLSTGRHNVGTRIFDLFTTALDIGILFLVANGPTLFEIGAFSGELEDLNVISDFIANNQHTIFTVLAVLTIIGFISDLIKLILNKPKNS